MAHKKEKVFTYVSTILQIGSFCAGGLLILGLGVLLIQGLPAEYRISSARLSFSDLISSLLKGEPTAIINLGILVMMFTPFLRVVVAVFSFFAEKDYRYAMIAFGVLAILLFTILPIFI
jgi:uncharacterized membrane protein